jgi:hypothetical protein
MRAKGLPYFLALFVAAPLVAQTAISADGVVESTSGGFRFPDGTVQESAVLQRCLSTRFLDQGDGTVFDCWMGLYWLKNANCFGPSNR